jgi:hypothetical protein
MSERPIRKVSKKDASLEPDPVWMIQNGVLRPTPFFQDWFERVAETRFGDKQRWWEAAMELGYVCEWTDSYGHLQVELLRFDYDHDLHRESLGLLGHDNMVFCQIDGLTENNIYKLILQRKEE